jgi:lipoprotein
MIYGPKFATQNICVVASIIVVIGACLSVLKQVESIHDAHN